MLYKTHTHGRYCPIIEFNTHEDHRRALDDIEKSRISTHNYLKSITWVGGNRI